MTYTARWMKVLCTLALAFVALGYSLSAGAVDLPLASSSALIGVPFDDRPLLLPVQRNFQMAMLTASTELSRSCGKMEAFGWRMNQNEQGRADKIFNGTVERLRRMGYSIEPQTLSSVSKDITLITADRTNKHFLLLWSAGELGLVLNVCETTAPVSATYRPTTVSPSVQVFPMPSEAPTSYRPSGVLRTKEQIKAFTPVGKWVGGYTCSQGFTGGTLEITSLKGLDFEGVFKFYPTDKSPNIPNGSYGVYGQYDRESNRILINPGRWIKRPHNYYNTVIVGSFDPATDQLSAYFQGISGCTSFEARRDGKLIKAMEKKLEKVKPTKKAPVKKKAPAKPKQSKIEATPLTTSGDLDKKELPPMGIMLPPAGTETATPISAAPELQPAPASPAK